jgi:hypothetical protein
MSQSPADSLSTIEDRTLYDGVYNVKEGVPREEVSKEEVRGAEQSQVSDTAVRITRRLPVIVAGRSARQCTVSGRPCNPKRQTRGPP